MRRIVKGPEPAFLTRYRRSAGPPPPTFNDLAGHQEGEHVTKKARLRAELIRRQGWLCCYCQGELKDDETTRIEHFEPGHDDDSPRALDWSNLWAACSGGTGLREKQQHCDVHKGQHPCRLDPATVWEEAFVYHANGQIEHRDAELNRELGEAGVDLPRERRGVLNLNATHLVEARRSALQAMTDAMLRHPGTWTREVLARKLAALAVEDPPRPHVGVLRYYLRRKLERAER